MMWAGLMELYPVARLPPGVATRSSMGELWFRPSLTTAHRQAGASFRRPDFCSALQLSAPLRPALLQGSSRQSATDPEMPRLPHAVGGRLMLRCTATRNAPLHVPQNRKCREFPRGSPWFPAGAGRDRARNRTSEQDAPSPLVGPVVVDLPLCYCVTTTRTRRRQQSAVYHRGCRRAATEATGISP